MKSLSLLSTLVLAGALSIGATFNSNQAMAQSAPCGSPYVVQRGDSLSLIAQRAYGAASYFQFIYSANSGVIGTNPGLILEGSVFQIPCLNALAPSSANPSLIRLEQTTGVLPAPGARQIRVVVGTDWAPFTDEDQEQGGMATEVTNVALSLADGSPSYKIDFINDWGAHLQPLITDHAYDFSIAWFKPNCAVVDRLSDDSKFRCNNLDWSLPIFEQIIGYYTRIDHPRPSSHRDLFGQTICRPTGYATFMMEEKDLVEPNIVFESPEKTTDCFEGLVSGKYDAVVLATDTAEGAITKIGAKTKVAFHEHLSYVATMHAVIAKTNPRRQELLARLNSGIQRLKESGQWFQIVARHMAQHRAKTQ